MTWDQALAWRMRRQLLDPVAGRSVADVVGRLCGVQAQVASSAELCVRVRRTTSKPGDVARALRDGRIIKTWAMRGTLHLLTPDDAGAFLSLLAAGRMWERPSWVSWFGITPKQLVAAVTARRGFGHVGDALRSGWGSLLKPFAWQGDLCFGPSQGNRVTFTTPESASSRWAGVPEPDEAAPIAIAAYLRAYGPSTVHGFARWLSRGRISKKQLRHWFDELGPRLAQVEVGGEPAYVLARDLDDLISTKPTRAVRLLPGFDQYVMGPGTEDAHVVPAKRRRAVSKKAGWIAPVVVARGVVRGTWEVGAERLAVTWFTESGAVPRSALLAETARLSTIAGRTLRLEVSLA